MNKLIEMNKQAHQTKHLEHIEDLIRTDTQRVATVLDQVFFGIQNLSQNHQSDDIFTIKYDGAPAIVYGITPDWSFFLSTKSAFNKKSVYCTSIEDIQWQYWSNPWLAKKLCLAFMHLSQLPHKWVYQAEYLFDREDLQEFCVVGDRFGKWDTTHLGFRQNTLTYLVDKHSDLANEMQRSFLGLAVHTQYKRDDGTLVRVSWVPQIIYDHTIWTAPITIDYLTTFSGGAPDFDIMLPTPRVKAFFEKYLSEIQKTLNKHIKDNLTHNTTKRDLVRILKTAILTQIESVACKSSISQISRIQWKIETRTSKVHQPESKLTAKAIDTLHREILILQKELSFYQKQSLQEIRYIRSKVLQGAIGSLCKRWFKVQAIKNEIIDILNSNSNVPWRYGYPDGTVTGDGEWYVYTNGAWVPVKLVKRHLFSYQNFTSTKSWVRPWEKTCFVLYGRSNPPTRWHITIAQTIAKLARDAWADFIYYVTKTQDSDKNPISVHQKIQILQSQLPWVDIRPTTDTVSTIIDVIQELANQWYKWVILAGGSDRDNFISWIQQYGYEIWVIIGTQIVGETRKEVKEDLDEVHVSSISASRARMYARKWNRELFVAMMPESLHEGELLEVYNTIRSA